MTLFCRQCNATTLTKLVLSSAYEVDHKEGNLINFLEQLQLICSQNDDSGLSYTPYKGVIATKFLLNFTNPRPDDPHEYKEELKIKYSVMTIIAGKFPNGTGLLKYLLAKEIIPLNCIDYFGLSKADWVTWKGRIDELWEAMLILANSKNEVAKKDLPLTFAQGNHTSYPQKCE